ncbi:MAG: Type I Iterative PKS [Bathelium mastoideum]|nr:MAG: Type I Iterative PKS [Bathelium mastoideum]
MDYSDDPIAVIGLSAKLPQEAVNVEKFWQMLMAKTSARGDPPQDRYNVNNFRSETGNAGKGHYLRENIQAFDASFFSIKDTDAHSMDPTHRLMLEIVYHALENAGLSIEQIAGSKTSVFITTPTPEYDRLISHDLQLPGNAALGVSNSLLANRISWFLDLKGLSMTIDSACSSSLVALHLACQSIKLGESPLCIIAAGSLCLDPHTTSMLSDLNCLSPDGICYSFDSRANGFSRGEGFSALILKPYSKAVADGNTIRAIIRATHCTQTGRNAIMTHTDIEAQEDTIKATYEAAGLNMAETRYIEAHGTGTKIGDPSEALAIINSFRPDESMAKLFVGAVKTNVGHLEGASAMVSLIKTISILEKAVIPPNAWFEHRNPAIPEHAAVEFPTKAIPWPEVGLRRASINAFGLGGANAHAILEDAYGYSSLQGREVQHVTRKTPPEAEVLYFANQEISVGDLSTYMPHTEDKTEQLFVWSTADANGLERIFDSYLEHFQNHPLSIKETTYMQNLAWTLCTKRTHLPWRRFKTAASFNDLKAALANEHASSTRSLHQPMIGYVFSGQGSQWQGMAQGLLSFEPFKTSLKIADEYLQSLGAKWSLIQELERTEGWKADEPLYSQPLTTALQIGLVDLLFEWKIAPTVVLGHSSGEIAAAYCSGAISRQSALEIAYYRGIAATAALKSEGPIWAMLSVGLSAEAALARMSVSPFNSRSLEISCYNSPNSVTVSGVLDDVERLENTLHQDGIFVRRLKIPLAYHSRQMHLVAESYRLLLQEIQPGDQVSTQVQMVSSLTGMPVQPESLQTSEYWVKNLSSPVMFDKAFSYATSEDSKPEDSAGVSIPKINVVAEVGTHSSMKGPIQDCLRGNEVTGGVKYVSALVKGKLPRKTVLEMVGQLYCFGTAVNFPSLFKQAGQNERPGMLVDLPSYPFDHKRKYWGLGVSSASYLARPLPPHGLLGTPVKDWNPLLPRWEHCIKSTEHSWIQDHKVNGTILYPAAGMVIMAMEAVRQLVALDRQIQSYRVRNLHFVRMLQVPQSDEGVRIQTCFQQVSSQSRFSTSSFQFRIMSYEYGTWHEICFGQITAQLKFWGEEINEQNHDWRCSNHFDRYHEVSEACLHSTDAELFYNSMNDQGVQLGPHFQSLRNIRWSKDHQAVATANIVAWKNPNDDAHIQVIHPCSLDAALQSALAATYQGLTDSMPAVVPTTIRSMDIFAEGISHCLSRRSTPGTSPEIAVFSENSFRGFRNVEATLSALDNRTQEPLISALVECTFAEGPSTQVSSPSNSEKLCHYVEWKPDMDLENEWLISSLRERHDPPIPSAHRYDLLRAVYAGLQYICHSDRELPSGSEYLSHYRSWAQNVFKSHSDELPTSVQGESSSLYLENSMREVLCERIPDCEGLGSLVAKALEALPKIFKGEVNALDIFFGNEPLLSRYYEYTSKKSAGIQSALQYLDLLAHKRPQLRILEVGAGTGAATREVLSVLTSNPGTDFQTARFSEYVFTDISREFFQKASRFFSRPTQGRMKFEILDIEEDSIQQGFDEGSFDIIIASSTMNTLPATFVFGLLPGWWRGAHEGRIDGPLISRSEWDKKLRSCGFSGAEVCIPLVEEYHQFSTIITTKDENACSKGILHDDNAVQHQITNGVCRYGVRTSQAEVNSAIRIIVTNSPYIIEVAQELKSSLEHTLKKTCAITELSDLVGAIRDAELTIMLPEIESAILNEISESDQVSCRNIINSSSTVLWVYAKAENEDPKREMVSGLFRSLFNECGEKVLATLALESYGDKSVTTATINRVACSLEAEKPALELEYMEIDARIHIPRIISADRLCEDIARNMGKGSPVTRTLDSLHQRPMKLTVQSPGLLDTFIWVDHHLGKDVPPHCLDIDVKAVGLNFRDVLVARGQGVGSGLGMECSGVVLKAGKSTPFRPGERVACIMAKDAFATTARCEADCAMKLPDNISFEKAAACLVVYYTAYAALVTFGRIQDEDSILIHSAAGGLGQACIQLARLYKNEVFATVGNAEKKEFLHEHYGIPEDHILLNTSTSFEHEIMRLTKGHGVDIVLNSLPGEALQASWACIARFGRFLEVGKTDIHGSTGLPMLPFSKNASFTGFDLFNLLDDKRHKPLLPKIAADTLALISEGHVSEPFPLQTYSSSRIESAFKFLESGKSIGKLVIKFQPEDSIMDKHYTLMTASEFNIAIEPKVAGSWNLHSQLPQNMDFFVLLSSLSAVIGFGGQANYASGNAYQDALARYRVKHGLKAVSLNLPSIERIGYTAEFWAAQRAASDLGLSGALTLREFFESRGLRSLDERELFALLDYYCDPQLPVLTVEQANVLIGLDTKNMRPIKGTEAPRWPRKPMFGTLSTMNRSVECDREVDTAEDDRDKDRLLSIALREAQTLQRALAAVSNGFQRRLAHSPGISVQEIETQRPIPSYGIDSLSAVGITAWFRDVIGADILLQDVLSNKPIADIVKMAVAKSGLVAESIRQSLQTTGEGLVHSKA